MKSLIIQQRAEYCRKYESEVSIFRYIDGGKKM